MTQLAALLADIAAAQSAAQSALDAGDVETWMTHTRALRVLERRRDREWEKVASRTTESTPLPMTGSSAREQARNVLDDLRVPASLNQITSWHYTFYGEDIAYKAVSSLRHDEKASFTRAPQSRPWYIVPALTIDTFTPVRGLLGLSDWSAVDRLVGPLTQRTIHLRITIAIADRIDSTGTTAAAERLLWRFASTLPGARQLQTTPSAMRAAAEAELAQLDEPDRAAREAALVRHAGLDDTAALFGAPLRQVTTTTRRHAKGQR